jgi:hypothetical protein
MKKVLLILLLSSMLFGNLLMAQTSWLIAGNTNITTSRFLGTTNNQPLIVKTNNAERMRILGNGNVGIGTTTPENTLHVFKGSAGNVTAFPAPLIVENSANCYIQMLSPNASATGILFGKPQNNLSGGMFYNDVSFNPNGLDFRTNGNITRMVLNSAGNLLIGTTTDPAGNSRLKVSQISGGLYIDMENATTGDDWGFLCSVDDLFLTFNGFAKGVFDHTTGAYTSVSDERLKTNIKPMTTMLEKIGQLKPSTYQFKNTKDTQEYNGFIAQDVMKIFPSLVMHNVNPERKLDVYTMDYSGFGVLAIKGIQELEPVVEEQKIVNDEQKEEIATLKERISKLEAALATLTVNNGSTINTIAHTSLEQNKPNPFNKSTIIRYSIPQGSKGQINIYDQTGKLVKALKANESGQSEISGYDLISGTYTYTLMVNGKVALSKQMLIIK